MKNPFSLPAVAADSADPAESNCRNCGTPLQGDFCYNCGQKESTCDHDFLDLAGDLFVWDSRFWRTLIALLIKPGFLTAEYIAGRKARYMPPLRLYLVISFFMFLLLSLQSNLSFDAQVTTGRKTCGPCGGIQPPWRARWSIDCPQ
jgi:hypothetical protein